MTQKREEFPDDDVWTHKKKLGNDNVWLTFNWKGNMNLKGK